MIRKIILIIICLALLNSFWSLPVARAAVLSKAPNNLGLVGYWSFNEGVGSQADDYSGNKYSGTLTGSPLPAWVNGKRGQALSFDTSRNWVNVGAASPLNMGMLDFTMAAFVKRNNSTGRAIIEKRGTGLLGYLFLTDYNAPGRVAIFLNDSISSQKTYVFNSANLTSTTDWYHVVVVVSRSTNTAGLYVNGSFVQSLDISATSGSIDGDGIFRLGYDLGGSPFNGSMDEVRLYKRALSSTEITALYQAGSVTLKRINTLGLVGYWPMNEDGGDIAGDFSGNKNDATLNGAPVWVDGKHGKALSFDGTGSYIDAVDGFANFTNGVTVAVWAKPTATKLWARFMDFGNANAKDNILFTRYSNTNNLTYETWNSSGVSGGQVTAANAIINNEWHFYAVTHNPAGTVVLYRDNIQIQTGTSTPPTNVTRTLNYIGRSNWVADQYYQGLMDDMRIYNRALSQPEIQALYQTGEVRLNASQNSELTNGLVGFWSFNGPDVSGTTAYDRSATGNNGTINGARVDAGKVGQALRFNGSSNYVAMNDNPAYTLSSGYTISAWIKVNSSIPTSSQFISQWGGGGVGNASWSFDLTSSRYLGIYNYNGASSSSLVDTTTQLSLGEWYHVVGVYSGGTTGTNGYIYVNGSPVKSGTLTIVPQDSNYQVMIGRSPVMGSTSYFPGIIDEVRIYNRALTSTEIQQLYSAGK